MRNLPYYILGFLFWVSFTVLVFSPTPGERDARAACTPVYVCDDEGVCKFVYVDCDK